MTLAAAGLVAFVSSRDLESSERFYGGVLGLDRVEASDLANAYEVSGTYLRVTRVERHAPSPYTVLGWRVEDIHAEIRALAEVGLRFKRYEGMAQDEEGVWRSPGGSMIAWFEDPDGNILSMQQPSRLAA